MDSANFVNERDGHIIWLSRDLRSSVLNAVFQNSPGVTGITQSRTSSTIVQGLRSTPGFLGTSPPVTVPSMLLSGGNVGLRVQADSNSSYEVGSERFRYHGAVDKYPQLFLEQTVQDNLSNLALSRSGSADDADRSQVSPLSSPPSPVP